MTIGFEPVLSDRDLRQRDLIPPQALARCHGLVVGVGAIGRQVALQLAALGAPSLELVDHDRVEVPNLAAQGYYPSDLGTAKVDATAAVCRQLNPRVELHAHAEPFRRSMIRDLHARDRQLVVCSCVDSMTGRRTVYESVQHRCALFLDARMAGESLRVLTAGPASGGGAGGDYALTLFGDDRAQAGSCTGRSTVYAANIAAGLMVHQFTRWLRRLPTDPDLMLNLLASELSVPCPPPPSTPGDPPH